MCTAGGGLSGLGVDAASGEASGVGLAGAAVESRADIAAAYDDDMLGQSLLSLSTAQMGPR